MPCELGSDSIGDCEVDRDVVVGTSAQICDSFDRREPTLADDRDAVAHALHLVEVVRGEKDRPPTLAVLGHDSEELLLHQRVKPRRRFVEHEQLGVVERSPE